MSSSLLSFRPLIDRYLRNISSPLSAYSFVNIFIWQDFFKFDIVEIDGHLCIFAADEAGTFMYLPPLAKTFRPGIIEECFNRMQKLNKDSNVSRIDNVTKEQAKSFPKEKYVVHEKGHDYVCVRRDLADLKGEAFKSKRNAVNHFIKHDASEYQPFVASMASECAALYENWAQTKLKTVKDDMHRMMIEDNRLVHRRIFKHWQDLGLVGRVVSVKDKVVAYTFGYFLNTDTFCDLVEIADPEFKGAATTIFWQLCNDPVLRDVRSINVMDDAVPESVNRTKMSFRPSEMLPSYVVSLKK